MGINDYQENREAMAQTFEIGPDRKDVSRVVQVGKALYVGLPKRVCELAGLKRGDRLAIETDGRMVFAVRIPFEELLARPKLRRQDDPRVQVRPDEYVRERD